MLQSVTRPYPQTQCRAVSGVGVSWVKSSNCFRRLEQSALPSIFDIRLSSVMAWNLQSCPTTVLNERMWHIWGSAKHTLTPSVHISRASRPSNDQNLRNCAHRVSRSQPGNYLPPPPIRGLLLSTICGDTCPLSCVKCWGLQLAQCTRPQGQGS